MASPSAQWSFEKLLYRGSTSRLKHVCAVGSESAGPDDEMIASGGVSAAAPRSGRRPAPVTNCRSNASWTHEPHSELMHAQFHIQFQLVLDSITLLVVSSSAAGIQ